MRFTKDRKCVYCGISYRYNPNEEATVTIIDGKVINNYMRDAFCSFWCSEYKEIQYELSGLIGELHKIIDNKEVIEDYDKRELFKKAIHRIIEDF